METNAIATKHLPDPFRQASIKPIPRWWKFVPILNGGLATTIYPAIYLPRAMHDDAISDAASHETIAVIIHEETHLQRQHQYGPWRWYFRYILFGKFRLEEELIAIKNEMSYRKRHGLVYGFKRKARQFSALAYFYVVSYNRAMKLLQDLWNTV